MSKAFLRESDFDEIPVVPRKVSLAPNRGPNYLTQEGHDRLRAQLGQWVEIERPALVQRATDRESRAALTALNQRIWEMEETLRTATVDPGSGPADVVRFGAKVSVREADGSESTYWLVGADEAKPDEHRINWQSPLGQALVHHRVGEKVTFAGPRRPQSVEILAIEYPLAS